jgi:hypothetical protein
VKPEQARAPTNSAPVNREVTLELSANHVGASVSNVRAIPHAFRYAAIKIPSGFSSCLADCKNVIRSRSLEKTVERALSVNLEISRRQILKRHRPQLILGHHSSALADSVMALRDASIS